MGTLRTRMVAEPVTTVTARRPHIGLNLVFLVPGETGGMEVVARELIPALLAAAPELRFTAFIAREAAAAGDGPWGELLPAVTVPVHSRSRVQWVLGEQTLLPVLAARARVDLVHSLASTAPLWGPFRRVATVHDLIYARFPDAHSGLRDRGMRLLVPAAVRRSERVLADSQSTRTDLIELLGTPPSRIDVAPLGLAPIRRDIALSEPETRARLQLGERPVLLSLSAKRPHKNLLALIGALALIAVERRPLLVLPGYPTWHEVELRAHAAELGCRRGRAPARLGLPGRAGGPVGARPRVRVPLAVRGVRAARAGGDGPRRARRVLARLLAARGRRRRGADVRPPRRARDRGGDRDAAVDG